VRSAGSVNCGVISLRFDQSWYVWHSKQCDFACSGPGAWHVASLNPRQQDVARFRARQRFRVAAHAREASVGGVIELRMLQHISDDAENIALADERAAEQAAMALDSLYIAYSKDAKPANAAEVRAAINGLFQQLENPSGYNADQFASSLRRIHT